MDILELLEGWSALNTELKTLEERAKSIKDALRMIEVQIAGSASEKDVRDISHNGTRVRKVTSLDGDPELLRAVKPSLVRVSEKLYLDRTALREYWNSGEDARESIANCVREVTTYVVEPDARKGRNNGRA